MNGLVVCLVGLFLSFFFSLSFLLFVLADSVLMLILVLNIDPIPPDWLILIAMTMGPSSSPSFSTSSLSTTWSDTCSLAMFAIGLCNLCTIAADSEDTPVISRTIRAFQLFRISIDIPWFTCQCLLRCYQFGSWTGFGEQKSYAREPYCVQVDIFLKMTRL